ncbi:hypothetical protein [Spongiibacter marinus]|uniref:hypothetical protein n=1 Tax=Spongiibacter marinus TaxID=354246 RepID=UPI0035BE36EA
MKIEPQRKHFALSVIFSYVLVFFIVTPMYFLLSGKGTLERGLFFGAFSLIFGMPIFVFVVFIGFPVFRFFLLRMCFNYFLNVIFSFAIVTVLTVVLCSVLPALVEGGSILDIYGGISLIGIPTSLVALISAALYWDRTKLL